MNKISIAMATYNGAEYLLEQLQSFVDQTRQPDELIITDDCSTDQTEAIVRKFASAAPFTVEFHRNEKNLGYCGNFNSALMKTSGDLVFLSDQDDVWFPEKIEHMIGVAERNPQALVVMNDAALTDSGLNDVGLSKLGQIRSAGLPTEYFVMGCCCGVRRELLDLCLPIPRGFEAHDIWIAWFADGLNGKVVEDQILQYYRRHEFNTSQFIVNRTTRVTRAVALFHLAERLFHHNSNASGEAELERLRIFVDRVNNIRTASPGVYGQQLSGLQERYGQRIRTVERRVAVRKRRFLPRLFAAASLFYQGGYKGTSGLKSVLRDIIG